MTDVMIAGAGQSAIGRKLPESGLELTVDAALAAIADAGLCPDDIDGISTYPGFRPDTPAFSPVGAFDIKEALGLKLDWSCGGGEMSAQLGAIINAYAAIRAGLARHVLVFRTVKEGSGGAAWKESAIGRVERQRVVGEFQYILPYEALSAANWLGLYAQRYFHLYGATREQMAAIALNARRNAADNPKALFRDPLTMDDYLNGRMISTPLCLYDCDVPTDAATAFVVSAADALPASGDPRVRIAGTAGGIACSVRWDQPDMPRMAAHDVGPKLWRDTRLTPADVNVALLYDGFSFLVPIWLEALGFCEEGRGIRFVEGGERIARDGQLPVNPHGGQLGEGRTHGLGFVHEAVQQLRGRGGVRQIAGDPAVAAVSNGGGPYAGALLLTLA